jgi:hypothetical protein
MGQIPPKGFVMVDRWVAPRICAFDMECDLVQYENKVETTVGIHSWNILGESSLKGVQRPS